MDVQIHVEIYSQGLKRQQKKTVREVPKCEKAKLLNTVVESGGVRCIITIMSYKDYHAWQRYNRGYHKGGGEYYYQGRRRA